MIHEPGRGPAWWPNDNARGHGAGRRHVVGPVPTWARQNPDGGWLPPSLGNRWVCDEVTSGGVVRNPHCDGTPTVRPGNGNGGNGGGDKPVDPGRPVDPSEPNVIPLPASLPFLLAALAGLGFIARRKT